MQAKSFKVTGSKAALANLRTALLAETQAAQLSLTEPCPEPDQQPPPVPVRVRQVDLAEALFAFAIHVPAGIAAHSLYDWLRKFLTGRADAAQVRFQEMPQPPVSEKKDPAKNT